MPSVHQASFYCPACNLQRLFTKHGFNHTPHILIALFSCGLWVIVWLILYAQFDAKFHCTQCGFSDSYERLANPKMHHSEGAENSMSESHSQEQSWWSKLSASQKLFINALPVLLILTFLLYAIYDGGNSKTKNKPKVWEYKSEVLKNKNRNSEATLVTSEDSEVPGKLVVSSIGTSLTIAVVPEVEAVACSDGCSMVGKIDNQAVVLKGYGVSGIIKSSGTFLDNPKSLVTQLSNAKKFEIEIPMYGKLSKVMRFAFEGLDLARLNLSPSGDERLKDKKRQ